MKNILLVISMLISLFSISQDYPRYETDSLGRSVVVMTIEQAQDLDNKVELLLLFEELNTELLDYDSICIKVINDKNIVIAKQDLEIKKSKELLDNKDEQIENLQSQILDYKKQELLSADLIVNKSLEIKEHKDKIKKLKTKMVVGGGIGGLVIIGLIVLLIK
jgi:peptidoglycan hydrolase CwlO-like protein